MDAETSVEAQEILENQRKDSFDKSDLVEAFEDGYGSTR